MNLRTCEVIADVLQREGVTHVFGHTGGHVTPLWKALEDAGFELILNKHECNAVFMADGYVRASGRLPLVLVTAGPGITNLTTGMSTAYQDSIPLVAIGGTGRPVDDGRHSLQDGSGRGAVPDLFGIMKGTCKAVIRIRAAEEIPSAIRDAFRFATTGRPGPVFIDFPLLEMKTQEVEYMGVDASELRTDQEGDCSAEAVEAIKRNLLQAQRPYVLVGAGAAKSRAALMPFLERLGVPFALAPMAKGYVDEFHPLCLGVLRSYYQFTQLLPLDYAAECDFVLSLGFRFQSMETRWCSAFVQHWSGGQAIPRVPIAQVDPDPTEIGHNYAAKFPAVGSIESFIGALNIESHPKAHDLLRDINDRRAQFQMRYPLADGKGINPFNIFRTMEDLCTDDAVIVCDSGTVKDTLLTNFRSKANQDVLFADGHGTMGYSLPASFGAALATGRQTICAVGDSAFQMSCNEMGLLSNIEKIPVTIIVFDNGGSAINTIMGRLADPPHDIAVDRFENPDFALMAAAYGIKAYRVDSTEDFESALAHALKTDRPTLIHAYVDQSCAPFAVPGDKIPELFDRLPEQQELRDLLRIPILEPSRIIRD